VHSFIRRFREAGTNLLVTRPVFDAAVERTLEEAIGA
jgi:hypothetical protein